MRALGQLALALAFVLALTASVFADQMTGRYVGTGISEGTTLEMTHEGFSISGSFSGVLNGTFFGQTNGADYAEGFLTESGTTYTYYLNWTPSQLTITIYDTTGNQLAYAFVPQGSPTTPTTTTTTTTRPADEQLQLQPLDFYIYDGVQSGPFTIEEMTAKAQSGELKAETMVWADGLPDWTTAESIDVLAVLLPPAPPAPPAAASYYVLDDGQQVGPLSLEEVMARIDARETVAGDLMWTAGMEQWAAADTFAEFAEALAEPVPPPLPPTPPTPPPQQPPAPPVSPPTPPAQPETPAVSGETTGTPNTGIDAALEETVRSYMRDFGLGDSMDAAVACYMTSYKVLSPDEKQILIDSDLIPSPSNYLRINTAHPDLETEVQACFDANVN
jgi:hypothetical protein